MPRTYYVTTADVEPEPVDQAWMSLVLRWLMTWRFTPAQADHLMVIIKAQTRPGADSGGGVNDDY